MRGKTTGAIGLPPGSLMVAITFPCSCLCSCLCLGPCPAPRCVRAASRRRSSPFTPVWSTNSTSTRRQSLGRARRPSRSEPPMPSRQALAWQIRSSLKPSFRCRVGVRSFSSRGALAPSTTSARSIPAARAFCSCWTSSGTPCATKPPLGRPSRRLRPAASSSRQGRGWPGGPCRRRGLAFTDMGVSSRICRTIHRPPCGDAPCSRPSAWRALALCCSLCWWAWLGTAPP